MIAGVPCHSNAIERKNLTQKDRREWKRSGVVNFVVECMDDLEQQSMDDLDFGAKMPRGWVTEQKVDKTVWSVKFFGAVRAEVESATGVGKLLWKWSNYAEGTLIMAARRMRQEVLDDPVWAREYAALHGKPAQQLKMLKNAMFEDTVEKDKRGRVIGKGPSFLKQYQSIIRKPNEAIRVMELNFQDFMDWQKSFHLLQPITDEVYIRGLVARLQRSRLPLQEDNIALLFSSAPASAPASAPNPAPACVPVLTALPTSETAVTAGAAAVKAKKVKLRNAPLAPLAPFRAATAVASGMAGPSDASMPAAVLPQSTTPSKCFYMCSCDDFRHYCWCLHSMLKAIGDELIAKPYCPPAMVSKAPSVVGKRNAPLPAGRPAKARKGGALQSA